MSAFAAYFVLLRIVFIPGVAAIADSKGRERGAWVACAIFFGPPVALIVGFLEPLPRRESAPLPPPTAPPPPHTSKDGITSFRWTPPSVFRGKR